jgi:hypothetical protein
MALGGQEHLNVLRGGIENRREVGRCHLDDLTTMVSNAWRWLLVVWRIFGIEMFEGSNSCGKKLWWDKIGQNPNQWKPHIQGLYEA